MDAWGPEGSGSEMQEKMNFLRRRLEEARADPRRNGCRRPASADRYAIVMSGGRRAG
jgi:hypothetical protein